MSKYTTELRFICEQFAGCSESQGYQNINTVISAAIPKVFDFDFPIFDESYRNVLCTKILRHYYTREICEETVGLWKLRLETKLNEIMPYYNQLYKSELLDFNPLYDTDMTTENTGSKEETTEKAEKDTANKKGGNEYNRTNTDNANTHNESTAESTANDNSSEDSSSKDLYSDTPQGSLQNVDNEEYLTNARKLINNKTNNNTTTGNSNSSSDTTYQDNIEENSTTTYTEDNTVDRTGNTKINSTDQYITKITGKSGGQSYSKMLEDFRRTFLNIDTDIISDLSTLFFGLW